MLRLDINLLFTVVNLLIWYVIIRKFLFGPINKVISKREEALSARYQEAQKLQDEARIEKEKFAAFQAEMEHEREKAISDARTDARAEYENIVKDAKNKADEIVEKSKKEAELEKSRILKKTDEEIRSMILETAVKSMETSKNDGSLYDKFLTKAGETTHAEA